MYLKRFVNQPNMIGSILITLLFGGVIFTFGFGGITVQIDDLFLASSGNCGEYICGCEYENCPRNSCRDCYGIPAPCRDYCGDGCTCPDFCSNYRSFYDSNSRCQYGPPPQTCLSNQ